MKSLLVAGVVVSAVAVAGMWMGRVHAQTSTPVLYPFGPQVLTLGMVGLAPGQIARLNALNLLGCCSLADRPTQILSVPCIWIWRTTTSPAIRAACRFAELFSRWLRRRRPR